MVSMRFILATPKVQHDQQIGIAATFNTETAKEDQKFQLINKTIDKLPNQEACFV
jgi:hypothetical protein